MLLLTFTLTAAVFAALLLALALSVVCPARRIWPPPAQRTWQYYFVWVPTLLAFLGLIVVGILDWNSFNLPAAVRWSLGIALVLIGNSLAWVGVFRLSLRATSGAAAELVTDGPYRYTRNPQYLGDIITLLGWSIWSGSLWVIPLVVLGIGVFVLTPFAEEPWLEDVYGEAYRSYREKVPRFLLYL